MALTANRSEIAQAMGVSEPTIDRWVKDGCPVVQRGRRGVASIFSLPEVVKWWGDQRASTAAGTAPDGMDEIEKRTAQAKMLRAELELAKERGDVAPIRDYERAWAKAFAEIRTRVMNVPQRVVLQLIGCTDETEFKTKLRAELTLALQAASEVDLSLEDDDEELNDE